METTSRAIRWQRIAALAVISVLAVRALVVPIFVWDMLRYPIDYFIAEGDYLVYVNRLLKAEPIYSDSSGFPYLGLVYPPVCIWINAFIGKFFAPTLASARVIGLLPLLGVMLVTGLYLRRANVRGAIAIAAMLLIPCCYSMSHFLIMPRCDGWMVLFCLCSLYFLDSPAATRRDFILGGLFTSLALFTKQTALFGVAFVHFGLLIRNRRGGLIAAGTAVGGCVVLLGLSIATCGPYFLSSMTSLTARRTLDIFRYNQFLIPLQALAVIAVVGVFRTALRIRRRQFGPLEGFIFGHALQTPLVFYFYSGSNYFLPFFAGLVIATALAFDDWLKSSWRPGPVVLIGSCLLALQLWLQLPYEYNVTPPDKIDCAEADFAVKFLTETGEPVYTERFWGCVANTESADHYFCEPTHLKTLPAGRLNMDVLEKPFKEKHFARLMLYGAGFHPQGFLDVVVANYRVVRQGRVKVCFGSAQSGIPVMYLERK